MRQAELFQMRHEEGSWQVYLVMVDGEEVPKARQRHVFRHRELVRAQTVCDALNNGMLPVIASGIRAERRARARA